MGLLSTRTLALLHDRLLFIWLQQHLHQDSAPVATLGQDLGDGTFACRGILTPGSKGTPPYPVDFWGQPRCYDARAIFNPDATCDGLKREAIFEHGGCLAVPGSISSDPNEYDVKDPINGIDFVYPAGWKYNTWSGKFWGSSEINRDDETGSGNLNGVAVRKNVWYQSCCTYPAPQEIALIKLERLRNAKAYVENNKRVVNAATAKKLLGGDLDRPSLLKLDENGNNISDETAASPSDDGDYNYPITKFTADFLKKIAGEFITTDQTGEALLRLLDGAIWERMEDQGMAKEKLKMTKNKVDRKDRPYAEKDVISDTKGRPVLFPKELPAEAQDADSDVRDKLFLRLPGVAGGNNAEGSTLDFQGRWQDSRHGRLLFAKGCFDARKRANNGDKKDPKCAHPLKLGDPGNAGGGPTAYWTKQPWSGVATTTPPPACSAAGREDSGTTAGGFLEEPPEHLQRRSGQTFLRGQGEAVSPAVGTGGTERRGGD
eukprot:g19081.t1